MIMKRTACVALSGILVALSGCKTRALDQRSQSLDDGSSSPEGLALVENYPPALLIAKTKKGLEAVCSAVPVQAGTRAQNWLVTTRACAEKDAAWVDTAKPSLQVGYLLSESEQAKQKLQTNVLELVDVEEYYLQPDQDKGLGEEPSGEEEALEEEEDSSVAVAEPKSEPFPYVAVRCSPDLAVIRVNKLPAMPDGFSPQFLPIADLDEQQLAPLREEPEFDEDRPLKTETEADTMDYLTLAWMGPGKRVGQGVNFGMTAFEVVHLSESMDMFAARVRPGSGEPNLLGFEIGSPIIGGMRREEPKDLGSYQAPRLYGIYAGQPKWKDSKFSGQAPSFMNLATCQKQIQQLITTPPPTIDR